MASPEQLATCIDQAAGRTPADLVIKNACIFNLVTGELAPQADIAVSGNRIVGTYEGYAGRREIDARGAVCVPGFIDTHVHIESTHLTPAEFDACVLPYGTTTAICDPHEMCNVLGGAALTYFLDAAAAMAMDVRVNLSSCVPATKLETSGAELLAADLASFRSHPHALGLAEFMNFPGVLAKDPDVLAKLAAFSDAHIDGHAPLLTGRDLNAYLACNIRTCHETTTLPEAMEKLRKGMALLIREGSVAKDMRTLFPALTAETSVLCGFCSDDRHPVDIAAEGHIDHLVRSAIAAGVPPLHAYRAASFSAARNFRLHDRGLIAPGQRADILILDDLRSVAIRTIIAGGVPLGDIDFAARPHPAPIGLASMKLPPVEPAIFATPAAGPTGPVIGVIPNKIVTDFLIRTLPYDGTHRHADPANDILKIAVLARHGVNRNVGRGFVTGFGFAAGALASSVGHDSHNVCVVGATDSDMAIAANRVIALGGGFVAVRDGAVLAESAFPSAGLISLKPHAAVRAELQALRTATDSMGCRLAEPFLQLAFLPLPVIPHLKITDFGLVDVDKFELIVA